MNTPLILCSASLAGLIAAAAPAWAQKAALPTMPPWLQKVIQAKPPIVGIRQGDSYGSGVLLQAQGCPLAVLTNKHVVPLAKPIELIALGRRLVDLDLQRLATVFAPEVDAALLVLKAAPPAELVKQATSIAELAALPPLFAGAPAPVRSFGYLARDMGKLNFKGPAGPVELVLTERIGASVGVMSPPLKEGYDLVMDVNVEQGMSGGPILNVAGQVVGINAARALPAWEVPAILRNGSQANPRLAELLDRSSLGLSMNQMLPELRRWQQTCMAVLDPSQGTTPPAAASSRAQPAALNPVAATPAAARPAPPAAAAAPGSSAAGP